MNDYELETRMRMYRVPVHPQNNRKKHTKPKKPNFRTIFMLCFVLVCAVLIYNIFSNFEFSFRPQDVNSSPLESFHFSPKRQNILFMGVDSLNSNDYFKGNRTDTMLIISIAPQGKDVNIISIPRDSKVYLSGKNKIDKINHAFAFLGAKGAVNTVEDTFGVKINHYVAICNQGVIQLIDILGGLPIYVEKDMKYDDYTAKLHVNLKQGNHILTGKETEGYLRFRHDSYGDIGRIRRQQWFFNALMARFKDPSTISKIPELLKVMPQYIQTDMSVHELAKYANMAKNIDSSSIQIATVPGVPSSKGVISYWIIDPDKTQELIDKMIYRNNEDINLADLSIGILYAESKMTKAMTLKSELNERGIENVSVQQSKNLSKSYIAIHNLQAAGETLNALKKEFPAIKDMHTIYDPIGINRSGKDVTIVIANMPE